MRCVLIGRRHAVNILGESGREIIHDLELFPSLLVAIAGKVIDEVINNLVRLLVNLQFDIHLVLAGSQVLKVLLEAYVAYEAHLVITMRARLLNLLALLYRRPCLFLGFPNRLQIVTLYLLLHSDALYPIGEGLKEAGTFGRILVNAVDVIV